MKLGVYGGTFDPPHRGHLAVAIAAATQLGLDRLELVPVAVPTHRAPPVAGTFDRFAMLSLAVRSDARLVPSPRELARGGPSFTVDTLRELQREFPHAALYLVIGADAYDDLPHWREPGEIVRLAHLAVLPRPGSAGISALRDGDRARVVAVTMPPVPVAARDIRDRLARGASTAEDLDPAVEQYIYKRGLYGTRPGPRDR